MIDSKIETELGISVRTRQDSFLTGFAKYGTILAAVKGINLSRQTVYNWLKDDVYGFRSRLEESRESFVEALEDKLFSETLYSDKPNPILLMFTLKAHNRAKYGDQVVVSNDKANELLNAVRGLPSGGVVVEGELVSGEEEVRRAVEG